MDGTTVRRATEGQDRDNVCVYLLEMLYMYQYIHITSILSMHVRLGACESECEYNPLDTFVYP